MKHREEFRSVTLLGGRKSPAEDFDVGSDVKDLESHCQPEETTLTEMHQWCNTFTPAQRLQAKYELYH